MPLDHKGRDYTSKSLVLLQVFIGEARKINAPRCQYRATTSAAVKARLSQTGQKKFVDHASAGHADPTLPGRCRMRGDHDPAGLLRRTESQVRTVVEGTADPPFWMRELVIWRKFQASMDLGPLQDLRVFANHDIRQPERLSEDGSRAV